MLSVILGLGFISVLISCVAVVWARVTKRPRVAWLWSSAAFSLIVTAALFNEELAHVRPQPHKELPRVVTVGWVPSWPSPATRIWFTLIAAHVISNVSILAILHGSTAPRTAVDCGRGPEQQLD